MTSQGTAVVTGASSGIGAASAIALAREGFRVIAAARAYRDDAADRIRRFLPMVRRLAWHVHGSGRDIFQNGLRFPG